MLLTIFPQQKKLENLLPEPRRKFATNFAENFANFTLEIVVLRIAGAQRHYSAAPEFLKKKGCGGNSLLMAFSRGVLARL